MGWGTASDIYTRVRRPARDLNHSDQVKILAPLVKELLDGDWDTWNEVIDYEDPVDLEVFRLAGIDLEASAKVEQIQKLVNELVTDHDMEIKVAEKRNYFSFCNDDIGFYETVWFEGS